jgi:hypothetical protein
LQLRVLLLVGAASCFIDEIFVWLISPFQSSCRFLSADENLVYQMALEIDQSASKRTLLETKAYKKKFV